MTLTVTAASLWAAGPVAAQTAREERLGATQVGNPAGQNTAAGQDAQAGEGPTWRVFGDYRLRGAMDRDRRSAPDRERIRLRLRLGGEVEPTPGLAIGARLSTAPDPAVPNSPYLDLGDGFRQARFALDRLYVRWQPSIEDRRPLTLWAGKFPNPLRQPAGYAELVWDADVHPEGLAAAFEPIPQLRLAVGGFPLLTRADASDVNMAVAQASVRLDPVPRWTVEASLGGYFYGTIDATAAAELSSRNRGNEVLRDAAGDVVGFASGFRIWQAHGAVGFDGLPVPLQIAGEYFANSAAAEGTDGSGLAVSSRIGELAGPGTYAVEYRYQDVGREAAFSSLVQDDFLDVTGFEGHIVGAAWQFLSFARLRVWTLWSRQPGEDRFQKRFRADLDFSWDVP